MTRSAVFIACVSLLCLGASSRVQAEPIKITGGSLVFESGALNQGGSISLVGTRGFSLQGTLDSGEIFISPLEECRPCVPTSTFSIGGSITGAGSGGVLQLTLDGQTYSDIASTVSLETLGLDLFGTITLPQLQTSPVVVTAPFTLAGLFETFDPDRPHVTAAIQGAGTASLMLAPASIGPFWDLRGVRYDFASTPTPEPATLTMVGGALVAAALRARKRRDRRTTSQLSTSTPTP